MKQLIENITLLPNQFWVFLTATASGFGWAVRQYFVRTKKNRNIYERILPAYDAIYDSLNDIIGRSKNCTRALILKCENGGGVPELGKAIHSSGVAEARKISTNRKKEWQKQRLDPVYIKNLLRLMTARDRSIFLNAEDFKGSVIYDVYSVDSVQCVKLSHLFSTKKSWYYLSCTFDIEEKSVEPEDRNIIRSNVNAIRSVLEKNKDILN
ncbi:MAG: hypothetical protein AAF988_07585 [Pseudomonadota bacterium]